MTTLLLNTVQRYADNPPHIPSHASTKLRAAKNNDSEAASLTLHSIIVTDTAPAVLHSTLKRARTVKA